MIALENLCKSYRTRGGWNPVLDGITCTFPKFRNIGILGLNGAGKSTLLRIIGGGEPPDRGRVRREGTVSWPIGFTGGFPGTLTGRENARFVSRLYGAPIRKVEAFTEAFADLGRYFDEQVRTYSSGMRARLGFAVSMAIDFDCYLIDEGFSVGDWRFTSKCLRAFHARRERSTVIMVGHNDDTIRTNCDIGAVLSGGKLTLYEDVKEAIAVYRYGQR
jgi:capsular polysaccharide transport system ATP-binding protein